MGSAKGGRSGVSLYRVVPSLSGVFLSPPVLSFSVFFLSFPLSSSSSLSLSLASSPSSSFSSSSPYVCSSLLWAQLKKSCFSLVLTLKRRLRSKYSSRLWRRLTEKNIFLIRVGKDFNRFSWKTQNIAEFSEWQVNAQFAFFLFFLTGENYRYQKT